MSPSPTVTSWWRRLPAPLLLAVFAGTVIGVGLLSTTFFRPPGSTLAVWWPVAGLGLVGVLLAERRQRGWVLAAHVVATATINLLGGQQLVLGLLLGAANGVQILTIITLLERGGRDPRRMTELGDLARFIGAVVAGAVLVAVLAAVILRVGLAVPMWATVRSVTPSHISALLLLGVLPMRSGQVTAESGRYEQLAQLLAVVVVIGAVFAPGQGYPLAFLPLPVLLWGALRSGLRSLALQLVAAGGVTAALTLRGGGPFAVTPTGVVTQVKDAIALVQIFSISMALVLLVAFLVVQGRRDAAAEVAARDERMRRILEQGLTRVIELATSDHGLVVVDANPIAERMFGTDAMQPGRDWCELLGEADRELVRQAVSELLAGRTSTWHGELRIDGDGGERWVEVALFRDPLPGPHGQLIAETLDVTVQRVERERLSEMALHDPLTGAANRTLLLDRLHHGIATVARSGVEIGVLVLDLDRFKPINDRHGHRAGDDVLVEIVRRLRGSLRQQDTVARIGGDEFAVLVAGAASADDLAATAERLREAVGEPMMAQGDQVTVGVSIGAAIARPDDDPEQLLHRADAAMYRDKRQGPREDDLLLDLT